MNFEDFKTSLICTQAYTSNDWFVKVWPGMWLSREGHLLTDADLHAFGVTEIVLPTEEQLLGRIKDVSSWIKRDGPSSKHENLLRACRESLQALRA